MIFVGIDPGQTGAIACTTDTAGVVIYDNFTDWKKAFKFLTDRPKQEGITVCIEKLWGMPIRGSQGNFSLGGNYTAWKALLEILELSYIEAAPATWQSKILNTSKKKSKETKPLSIEYVRKRFIQCAHFESKRPKDIKEYSGISDAICLALYGRYAISNLT